MLYVLRRQSTYTLRVQPFLDDRLHRVFATRYPQHPNFIGLSIVHLLARRDHVLEFESTDMLDGTPLVDTNPYVPEIDVRTDVRAGVVQHTEQSVTSEQISLDLEKGRTRVSQPAIGKALMIAASGLMLLYLTIPLVVVIVRAIDAGLVEELSQPTVAQAIKLSFVTTAISVLLMTVLGTPLAYWLARGHVPGRPVVETLLDLPIVLPPAVAGIALLMTFGRRGVFGPVLAQLGINLPFTTIAVVMAQVFVAAPFFIRSAQTGFVSVPREIEEGASDLGADAWRVFRYVTFPLAGPALLSGVILSGARALGEFGATILFAGNFIGRTQTMPLAIYQTMESDLSAALAVAAILVFISFGFLLVLRWITRGRNAHPLL